MALTWNTLQTALLSALAQSPPPYNVIPPDFTQLYPQATSYAEGRIYGDLVMLGQRQQNTSLTTTPTSRNLNLAAMTNSAGGPLIVLEGVALITPSGQSSAALGTRITFDEASLDMIDLIWPVEATTLAPGSADNIGRYWAMRDANTVVLAPTPDAAYTAEITGTYQPTPISSGNPTTYLSTTYPDLLLAACMVWLSGALMRNFGSQADDPKMALSWEAEYQKLVTNALEEETRRRGLAPNVANPRPRA